MRRVLYLAALLGLVGVAAVATMYARTELPEVDALRQSTFICDATVTENCTPQNAMAKIQGGEDRINVRYEDLPQHLIDAVVAMEDRDFFEHRGINPISIARALYRDIRGEGVQQGGSTITQQYVKNVFLTSERAISRKVREAVLAVKLEQRMSKQDILEGYLNTIYFGRGAYGVAAAAQAYFGKTLADLTPGDSAYLAGLIRAPALADATDHPEEAKRRRRTALVAMREEGYLTEAEATLFDAVPIEEPYFRPRTERRNYEIIKGEIALSGGDYITSYVDYLLKEEHGLTDEDIYGGGYRVYTSIDPMMQQAAWQAVNGTLDDPSYPVGALAAIDNQGLVRAMVGGRNYNDSEINHAVRGRGSNGQQVGSTFKAVALAELVRENKSLESRYNAPSELEIQQNAAGCEPVWKVHNYAESEQGQLTVRDATRVSSNTAYGQIMLDLGPEKVIQMAHDLGMTGDISPACGPIVLGTELSTPLEMATVYSTFANRGVRKTPSIITRIEQVDQDGNVHVVFERQPEEVRVLTEQQADIVTDVLQGVITDGTGHAADIGRPAAGKTGTAQANRDAWFVGYTPRLTAAIWMGHTENNWDDPETPQVEELRPPMQGEYGIGGVSVTGGSWPAQIWAQFMRNVHDHYNWNDPFPEVAPDVLAGGAIIGVPPTTTPPPGPPITAPGNGGGRGGPGRTTTTTMPPTTIPDTTQPTVTLPPDSSSTTTTGPGHGGGGGG